MGTPGKRAERMRDRRRTAEALAELVGLVRGVVADGVVSREEADRLQRWVGEHPEAAGRWPANLLAWRLRRIFADGRVDPVERRHLGALLEQIASNPGGFGAGFPAAADLPLTRPTPEIAFEGRTFVLAGEMAFGPWRACAVVVEELGGRVERRVSRRTDYLVLGSLSADDWTQGAVRPFLDDVARYRARGREIAVVLEEDWWAALP